VRCDNTGVPGELHYCRNGVVNDYALSFNLPIKTDFTEIYFSWVNAPPLGLQKPDITVSPHLYYKFIKCGSQKRGGQSVYTYLG